jgi:hypothetical protein
MFIDPQCIVNQISIQEIMYCILSINKRKIYIFCFLCSEEAAFFTRPGRNVGKDLDTLDAAEQVHKEKTTDYSEGGTTEQKEEEKTEKEDKTEDEDKTEEEEKTEDYFDEDEVEKILDYLDEEKMMTENRGDLQSKVWLAELW